MAKSKSFPIGHTVRITGTFKVDDVLTNPTTCVITVRDPAGVSTTPAVSSVSTGVRRVSYLTALAGTHRWRIEGTGTAAAVKEGEFYVASSGLG